MRPLVVCSYSGNATLISWEGVYVGRGPRSVRKMEVMKFEAEMVRVEVGVLCGKRKI